MTIDELNALTTLTAADEVPVWDSEESGEPTKKITASNLAASVKSLASLPNTTEMNAAIAQSTANMYPIYSATFTKKTSASGYFSITNDEIAGRYIPLAIFVVGTSDVCVEMSASAGTSTAQGSTTWWCACRKVDTWNAVASTSLNFVVYFIRP